MQDRLRQPFDIKELSQRQRGFSGQLQISGLERLASLLCDDGGLLDYDLGFDAGDDGLVRVSGEISGTLMLQCQRSLEPFAWPLSVPVKALLVASEEEEKQHQDKGDVRLCPQGEISIADLVEEEVILVLPLVPIDPGAEVLVNPAAAPSGDERSNPFAVLGELQGK